MPRASAAPAPSWWWVTGAGGAAYQAVNSCLLLSRCSIGQEIYTVEALAPERRTGRSAESDGGGGGSQCGYCTPGFVISLFAEHYRPDRRARATRTRWAAISAGAPAIVRSRGRVLTSGRRPTTISGAAVASGAALAPVRYADGEFAFDGPPAWLNAWRWPRGIPSAIDRRRHGPGGRIESALPALEPDLVSLEAIAELREFRDYGLSVSDRRRAAA